MFRRRGGAPPGGAPREGGRASLAVGGVDDQHVAGGAVREVRRDRPEDAPGQAVQPAVADHDQVGPALLRRPGDDVDGVARHGDLVDVGGAGGDGPFPRGPQRVVGRGGPLYLVGQVPEPVGGAGALPLGHGAVGRGEQQGRAGGRGQLGRPVDRAERGVRAVGADEDDAVRAHAVPLPVGSSLVARYRSGDRSVTVSLHTTSKSVPRPGARRTVRSATPEGALWPEASCRPCCSTWTVCSSTPNASGWRSSRRSWRGWAASGAPPTRRTSSAAPWTSPSATCWS